MSNVHGLWSSGQRHLRKETCAKVIGPHRNQVETKARLVRPNSIVFPYLFVKLVSFQSCRIDLNSSWLSNSYTPQVENYSNVGQAM